MGIPRTVALTLVCAAALFSAGAVGAATGVLPVGSVFERGADPEAAHEHGERQTVVARGTSPVAGPWRLTASRTEGDASTGEAAGDCLQLQLSDPPSGTPIEATMLCHRDGVQALAVGSLPVVDAASQRGELLLFGSAPTSAEEVELSSEGRAVRTGTRAPVEGFAGRPWIVAAPHGWSRGRLAWTAGDTARGALDVSAHLARLPEMERIAGLHQ